MRLCDPYLQIIQKLRFAVKLQQLQIFGVAATSMQTLSLVA